MIHSHIHLQNGNYADKNFHLSSEERSGEEKRIVLHEEKFHIHMFSKYLI